MSTEEDVPHDIPLGFWGAVLSANAKAAFTFTPPVGKAIRLSSASLAHNAKPTARSSLLLSCPSTSPSSASTPLTIATLSGSGHPSTLLDLYLLGGQQVRLQARGDGDVHVGGYCTVQDIGEEEDDDDEDGYEEGEGEGYLIEDSDRRGDDDEDEDAPGGRWMVPEGVKRRAAAQAVQSIIDELREDGGDDEVGSDLDDSDFIGELLEGENDDEDDDDEDEDDDAEMYEFGEEDEDAASNEQLADAIRQQLAGKIRVVGTDEEDSDEDRDRDGAQQRPGKKAAGKKATAPEGRSKSTPAKPAAGPAAAPKTPAQANGTAAAKKRPAEEQRTPAAPVTGKKQKTAAAAPETPSTAGTAAGSSKTVKCTGCSKMFSSEAAMQQHADIKHKAA